MRHGEASYDAEDDFHRELTERGRRSVESLVRFVAPKVFNGVTEIRHSPLIRAKQTALLFRDLTGLEVSMRVGSGLQPEDDPEPLVDELVDRDSDLMIVGHNPFLTFLAARLLTGRPGSVSVVFKKSGVLCLERATRSGSSGEWALRWYVTPSVIRD